MKRVSKDGRWLWPHKPFNPYGGAHVKVTQANTVEAMETVLTTAFDDLEDIAADGRNAGLIKVLATCVLGDVARQDMKSTKHMLDRILGGPTQRLLIAPTNAQALSTNAVDFETFCKNAGYPLPFQKQIEMFEFGMQTPGVIMLLGARGYGKTDYVVILGYAYCVYLDWLAAKIEKRPPIESCLLITKSKSRNSAILEEVLKAASANGVPFEKQSSSGIRVEGLLGKDHTLDALTIGSKGLRGHHPRRAIMDDPVTEDDVSEATRKKAQRTYNELTKLTENILIIGQPVHKWDLYETLRPLKGVEKLEVPHGSIPQLDHDLEAQRLAGVSEESIQASYHLKVISEVGNPLANVSYLDKFPANNSVAFIDPSFEGGDFTAITCIQSYFDGVAVFGRVFKKAWYDCFDELCNVIEGCNVRKVCFETNALGDQPVVMLREFLDGVGVVGKKSTGHKHSRIMAAGPFAKRIHLAKTSDRLYIEQIIKYEYGAKNDDAPDSLASAMEWIGLIRGRS